MSTFKLTITPQASLKIREYLKQEGENLVLRILLLGEGCCGYRYGLVLDDEVMKDDLVIQDNGIRVAVDKYSAAALTGSVIDYVENDAISGFVIKNPNERPSCGCDCHHSQVE